MTHDADTADQSPDLDKGSKRDRFRDALTRTKSKFKKERVSQEEFKLSDDVNEFLAAGRNFNTTPTRSAPDNLTPLDHSPRPSTSESLRGRPPSRGALVPKIDVSQSQRWPNARPVDVAPQNGDHLYPGRKDRSQSFGAVGKKKPRPRGLSVSFDNGPPVIIGEGGDEAQSPPNEIASAKQRARSLSPLANRPGSMQSNSPGSQSPIRRKPVSPRAQQVPEVEIFRPKPIRRTQTGLSEDDAPKLTAAETLERQLQQALNLGGSEPEYPAPPQPQRGRLPPPPPPPIHHGQRLDATKPTGGNVVVTQHQQPQTMPIQYVPRPTASPGHSSSQIPHAQVATNRLARPLGPGFAEKPVPGHQQMQQQQQQQQPPPPQGWI